MKRVEWHDISINPAIGCSKCDEGCRNCYAEEFARKLSRYSLTAEKYRDVVNENGMFSGKIIYDDCACMRKLPKKPKRVFLGTMTDLFHEDMPEHAYRAMDREMKFFHPQHTFMVSTRRPENAWKMSRKIPFPKNMWIGISVSSQAELENKLPWLSGISATKRFISVEPMLGKIDFGKAYSRNFYYCGFCGFIGGKGLIENDACPLCGNDGCGKYEFAPIEDAKTIMEKIDWVICGGERGLAARRMNPEWVSDLRMQCKKLRIPFFFKGWGEWIPRGQISDECGFEWVPGRNAFRNPVKNAFRKLDGKEYLEFPKQGRKNAKQTDFR